MFRIIAPTRTTLPFNSMELVLERKSTLTHYTYLNFYGVRRHDSSTLAAE